MPIRFVSIICQYGLNAASHPSFTRRSCLAAWLVPLSQLLRGSYGCEGFERKKLIASSVPS